MGILSGYWILLDIISGLVDYSGLNLRLVESGGHKSQVSGLQWS